MLVTRSREQASELSARLRALGADAVEAPAITIGPPASLARLDEAISRLRSYSWAVFTSANGVASFAHRLRAAGGDARALANVSVCAIGPGTAEALEAIGITADLIPPTFTTDAVARAFPRGEGRVLLARADKVEPGLDEALRAKGWTIQRVVAYRLRGASRIDPAVRRAVLAGDIDVITFASGGTVRAFMKLVGDKPDGRTKIVCIGPVTAAAARAAGLRVSAVASRHTIEGLLDAVVGVATKRRGR
ncbi:MAG: uroporphyrinogen-III synthase [Actinomycetota bacterium]